MGNRYNLEIKLNKLGLKKKQLAKLMEVHPNTVTSWLAKEDIPFTLQRRIDKVISAYEKGTYLQNHDNEVLAEPHVSYLKRSHEVKRIDALSFCGKLAGLEDGLELQKRWRSEW